MASVTYIAKRSIKGAAYLYLPGTAGNYARTPDSVTNSVTGDITLKGRVAPDDNTPAVSQVPVGKWASGTNQRSYLVFLGTDGKLQLFYSRDGIEGLSATSTLAVGFADGTTWSYKITRNATTGEIIFYTSTDDVTFNQLGTAVAGTAGTLFDSTSPVEVGSYNSGASSPFAGKIYYAEVRNGIDGPVVAKFDPATDASDGATSFTSSTGEVWTINKSGSPYARIVGTGPAHSVDVAYTIDFDGQVLSKSYKTEKKTIRSMGGNTETMRVRRDTFWDVKTDLLTEADLDNWREFLASTDAGETFTLDPYGTSAFPNAPISVEREDDTDSEDRVGASTYYTVGFKVRAL